MECIFPVHQMKYSACPRTIVGHENAFPIKSIAVAFFYYRRTEERM